MDEINVICIQWGDFYGPEYVNRLRKGVLRNSTRDVRFFCLTDDPAGLDKSIEIIELKPEPFHNVLVETLKKTRRKGAMRKVSMFKPGLIGDLNGPLLAFDIDIVITGHLDELFDYAPGKICMRREWKPGWAGLAHGSVLKFDPSLHGYLYEAIARDPEGEILKAHGAEQKYTSKKAIEAGDFEPFPDNWIASFKISCRPPRPLNLFMPPRLPKGTKVVCFHGRPKMEEAVRGYRSDPLHWTWSARWLREAWSD